jgi:hypothetical protein
MHILTRLHTLTCRLLEVSAGSWHHLSSHHSAIASLQLLATALTSLLVQQQQEEGSSPLVTGRRERLLQLAPPLVHSTLAAAQESCQRWALAPWQAFMVIKAVGGNLA